jgi:disulfide bond formation protein DsbB
VIGVPTVSLFYALLAMVANLGVIVVVVLALAGRTDRVRAALGQSALLAAFVVALLATAGSLYFSEVARFEPCRLCWYQRIAMYPLVVILGIAAGTGDRRIARYVIPIAGIGAAISTYHYTLEWIPALDTGACSVAVPCTLVWFRQLGFISLPYLALSAFVSIVVLTWLATVRREEPTAADQSPGSLI